ncbi:hypothetical protein T440DRAFT_484269 [Plenodomus tracheiphilus IPT5]|uniref:Uncharacterized protein n=1 Tax=Plenodomus tracheiphilus IPT5 TaxID=1408161 RepID=A0A6A7ANK0_9PLEO|nr:hypothetical protein T440DRAFT_484269 [Plenodomus tracheiphilus IPT5]
MPLKLGAFGSAVLYRTALRHLGISQAVKWAVFADPTLGEKAQEEGSRRDRFYANACQCSGQSYSDSGASTLKSTQFGRNGRTRYTAGVRPSGKSAIAADWRKIQTRSCG